MDDLYSRLVPVAPVDGSSGEPVRDNSPLNIPSKTEQEGFFKSAAKIAGKAAADNLEMINSGVRLFINGVTPGMGDVGGAILPRGGPARVLGVDKNDLSKMDPLARELEPAIRGAAGMLTFPAPPGIGTGMGLGKTAVLGAGSGELGEVGKWILGPAGRWLGEATGADEGGATGEKIGGALGEVAGATAGGYANVVRMNAVGKALAAPFKAGASAVEAGRSTLAAKRAGDERDAMSIFLDHYGDLKTKGQSLIQERADNKVASVAARDPRSQSEVEAMNDALKRTEADAGIWSIGQRTNNPTLTAMEANRRLTGDQATNLLAMKEQQPRTIVDAYNRIVSNALPTNPKAMADSVELYRAGTLAKASDLEDAAAALHKGMTNFDSDATAGAGAALRGVLDQERGVAQGQFSQRYNDLFNQVRTPIDITPTLKDTADVLRPLLSKVDTDMVPDSIRQLHSLMRRSVAEDVAARNASQNVPFYMRQDSASTKQPRGYSMSEVDDLVSALGRDAHAAWVAKDTDKMNALNKVGESLLNTMQKQLPRDAWDSYSNIRSDYRDTFVPRFKEGIAYNLDREATAANKGMEKVSDQKILSSYLDKNDLVSRMDQFDNTFGGKAGGPVRKDAYNVLGKGVEDRYSKEVLTPGFNPERHQKFMSEYDSALDRLPDTRQRLDATAQKLDKIALDKKGLELNYKEVMGFPTTQQLGPAQAQQLFVQALADPLKMQKLLNSGAANTPEKAQSILKQAMTFAHPISDGVYDPDKLMRLLTMGPQASGDKTSLQMLFEKALGKQGGQDHMDNLKAIATLMKREAMTDPKYLRFDNQQRGPMQEAAGQSMASILTGLRSMDAGFGGTYFPLISAGRFVNNRVQKAVSGAMDEALYNPERAEHILELAKASPDNPMSRAAAEGIFGMGKSAARIIKDLSDHGMIKEQLGRGAAYGIQQAERDLQEPVESDAAKNNRQQQIYRGLR